MKNSMFNSSRQVWSVAALALALGSTANASVVDTQIYKIEAPRTTDGVYSILSTQDGRVYYADPTDQALVDQLRAYSAAHTPVHLVINDDAGDVIGVAPLSPSEARIYSDAIIGTPAEAEANAAERNFDEIPAPVVEVLPDAAPAVETPETAPAPATPTSRDEPVYDEHTFPGGYRPTILSTMAEAQTLFTEERGLDDDSQCHERAMVWAHDMFVTRGIKSMKTMMFFTEAFRSRYAERSEGIFGRHRVKPYKWWYHTAPYVYVGSQIVVLDGEFLESAVPLDQWTYWFTTKAAEHAHVRVPTLERARCRIISNYSEYLHQRASDVCLIRNFPMYYMQPNSVEAVDCNPARQNASDRPNEFLSDGRPKYPCRHEILSGFNRSWVNLAYDKALTRRDRRHREAMLERAEDAREAEAERIADARERAEEAAEEARERAEDAREDAARAAHRAERDARRAARRASN